jgi:regulator of RNase E activity RraA
VEFASNQVEPGTVADALRNLNLPFAARPGFKIAAKPDSTLSGFIRTLKIEKAASTLEITKNPNSPLQELINSNCESQILFIHSQSADYAYLGEITGNILKYAGLSGVAIQGSTRDIVGIQKSGLPVFSDGLTPIDVVGQGLKLTLDAPLHLEFGSIESGNFSYLSKDGLVVFDSVHLELVKDNIREMMKFENDFLSNLDGKVSNAYLCEVLDQHASVSSDEV